MGCLTTLQWKLGEIEMNKAYLGLGTNIGNRENYLREAGFDCSGVEVLVAKRDTPSVDFSI